MLNPIFRSVIFLGLILPAFQTLSAQNQVVRGVVVDRLDFTPLQKVEVCINGSYHCLATAKDGRFHALINDEVEINSITFSKANFADTALYFQNDLPEFVNVEMRRIANGPDPVYIPSSSKRTGGLFTVGVDVANFDFSQFRDFFPENFIDSLNNKSVRFAFGYDFILNRTQFGFRIGFNPARRDLESEDSLIARTGDVMYELHGMYNFLRTEHFTCGPMLALKWYRHRMRISSGQESLPLDEYLSTREVDLRFNHLTAFLGAHFMFKTQGNKNRPGLQLIIGGNAGVLLPLHPDTWVKTRDHRIDSPADVQVPELNFSVYVALGNDS